MWHRIFCETLNKKVLGHKGYFSEVLCVNLAQTQFFTNQYTQMVCEPDAVTWTNMGKEWSSLIDLLRLPWKQFWIHLQHHLNQSPVKEEDMSH